MGESTRLSNLQLVLRMLPWCETLMASNTNGSLLWARLSMASSMSCAQESPKNKMFDVCVSIHSSMELPLLRESSDTLPSRTHLPECRAYPISQPYVHIDIFSC